MNGVKYANRKCLEERVRYIRTINSEANDLNFENDHFCFKKVFKRKRCKKQWQFVICNTTNILSAFKCTRWEYEVYQPGKMRYMNVSMFGNSLLPNHEILLKYCISRHILSPCILWVYSFAILQWSWDLIDIPAKMYQWKCYQRAQWNAQIPWWVYNPVSPLCMQSYYKEPRKTTWLWCHIKLAAHRPDITYKKQ